MLYLVAYGVQLIYSSDVAWHVKGGTTCELHNDSPKEADLDMRRRDAARWIELYRLAELETEPERFIEIVTKVNQMIEDEQQSFSTHPPPSVRLEQRTL